MFSPRGRSWLEVEWLLSLADLVSSPSGLAAQAGAQREWLLEVFMASVGRIAQT